MNAEGRPARLLLERAGEGGDRLTADFEWSVAGGLVALRVEAPERGAGARGALSVRRVPRKSPEAFRLTLPPDIPIQRLD